MKITFCCPGTKAEPWLHGLAAALPGSQTSASAAARRPRGRLRRGLGTAPAVHRRTARACGRCSTSARGWMRCSSCACPRHARVVRLDDAGMAVQMAEYVTPRGDPAFPRSSCHTKPICRPRAEWKYRKPAPARRTSPGRDGPGRTGRTRGQARWPMFEFPGAAWSRSPKHIDGRAAVSAAKAGLQRVPAPLPACWSTCSR